METKEYIVALHKGVDYDQFWAEMENPTSGLPYIPDRAVSIYNDRNGLDRHCEYYLTDDEAEKLRNDPRVLGVEIPLELNPNVKITIATVQSGNFTKPSGSQSATYSSGTNINWGLVRHSNIANVYGTGLTFSANTYQFAPDGTGVDVIISDTGIQADHPEFQFLGNTTSRVKQINWYTTTGVSGLNGVNSYIDYNGHGTNVCGIATGKTYGWAKGADIYSIKSISGASGDTAASAIDTFQAVKLWHQAKTNGRPTVLNMSWVVSYSYSDDATIINNITSVGYRGTTYTSGTLISYGIHSDYYSEANGLQYESLTTDAALDDLASAGVIVCRAAGNNGYKIDSSGGVDYNNYFYTSSYPGTRRYYHRGFSPKSTQTISVGSIDVTPYSASIDQKASYSCAGPGVDVFAAGTNIMSAGSSNDSSGNTSTYFLNSSYKQFNDTGTSQASPQVAGMCALYLQANPTATPAQVKNWLKTNANTSALYTTGLTNDYSVTNSQFGGNAGVAYQAVQGLTQIKDNTGTWKYVANIKVKTDTNTWSNVRAIWTKVDSNTWKQSF